MLAMWHLDAMLEGSVVGTCELLTSTHCHLVPFVCAGGHLWAMVVSFSIHGIGCGVMWCCDVRHCHRHVQWWLGQSNDGGSCWWYR